MSQVDLKGLYCVNGAGTIGLVTRTEMIGAFRVYVGTDLDGEPWQSSAPLVIRPQRHVYLIPGVQQ